MAGWREMKHLYLALGLSLAVACVCGAIIFYVLGAERAKDALDDARQRLETIDTVKDLENEAENTSDDDLANSISDVSPGGR